MALAVGALAAAPHAAAQDLHDRLQDNAWYLPAADESGEIFVTSLGQGPKVVVLHGGFGANFEYMLKAVEPHLGRHEFILYDQRGSLLSRYHGKTDELTVDDLVEDLERLRKQLGEERLVLMAHSMGTRLAMEYSRRFPDHVASLILIGSFPPRHTQVEAYQPLMEAISARAEAMSERDVVKTMIAKEGFDLSGLAEDLQRLDEMPGVYRKATNNWRIRFAGVNMVRIEKWRTLQGGRAYYNGEAGGQLASSIAKTWDLPAAIGSRSIPVSVLQGDQDYVDPGAASWLALRKQGEGFARCLEVDVIGEAGHAVWLDDPDAFHRGLSKALSRKAC